MKQPYLLMFLLLNLLMPASFAEAATNLNEITLTPTDRPFHLTYRAASADDKIKAIARQIELIYFFEGSCQYCYRFAPMLKHFAQKYGFAIIPISLDGRPSQQFPLAEQINEQSLGIKIPVVPAVFMLNPSTRTYIPLTYGAISQDQLLQKILDWVD